MNASNITALIGSITALIVAVTTLITLIVHIIRHQPIPGDKPANSSAKPGMVDPAKPRWDRL